MRTTITIAPELLQETLKISGKKKYSEAIVTSLKDYIALKGRLGFLEKLTQTRLPHRQATLKKQRKKDLWS